MLADHGAIQHIRNEFIVVVAAVAAAVVALSSLLLVSHGWLAVWLTDIG